MASCRCHVCCVVRWVSSILSAGTASWNGIRKQELPLLWLSYPSDHHDITTSGNHLLSGCPDYNILLSLRNARWSGLVSAAYRPPSLPSEQSLWLPYTNRQRSKVVTVKADAGWTSRGSQAIWFMPPRKIHGENIKLESVNKRTQTPGPFFIVILS